MIIYEITLQIHLQEMVPLQQANSVICKFMDCVICQKKEFQQLHESDGYKNYCFNSFYPLAENGVYQKEKNYKLQIRTVEGRFAEYLQNQKYELEDRIIQVTGTSLRLLPQRTIDKLYSITPCIMKTEQGYWREHLTEEQYLEALKVNLVKKYQSYTGQKFDENFTFLRRAEFMNQKPILCKYKQIHLLGDKMDLYIEENPSAQELAYFALGVGILEGNARGFGFVNDKWRN